MKTLAFAFLLFATASVIEIDTSTLTEPKAWLMGNRRVTAEKVGDTTTVRVEEDGRVDTVMIRKADGKTHITRSDNGVARRFLFTQRARVIVDGMDLEPFLTGAAGEVLPAPAPKRRPGDTGFRFYVCPRDQAVLRVPAHTPEKTLACPVDGTVMKTGVGPDRKYWLLD